MADAATPTCRDYFRLNNFGLVYSKPKDFVNFQCGFHKLYVFWRIFWAVYHFIWIILTGVYSYQWAGPDPAQQVKWFIYLTDWAYFALTLSTIIDAICVIYISVKKDDILQDISPIMPWYLKVDWVLFNISNTISALVSIMYWSLIYTSSEEMTAVNIETHALNFVYVIINLFMTGIPVRFYHFFHPMIFGAVYVIFSVIYEVSGGTNHQNKSYIYSVLDWSNTSNSIMLSLIVVLVAIPILHFVIFLLHLARIYLNKKCCSRNKRSCTIITPDPKSLSSQNSLELNRNNGELNHHKEAKIDMDLHNTEVNEELESNNIHVVHKHYENVTIKSEIKNVSTDVYGELIKLRKDSEGEMIKLKTDTEGERIKLNTDTDGELIKLNTNMDGELIKLQTDTKGERIKLKTDTDDELLKFETDTDEELIKLHKNSGGELIKLQTDENCELVKLETDGEPVKLQTVINNELTKVQTNSDGKLIKLQTDLDGELINLHTKVDFSTEEEYRNEKNINRENNIKSE